MNRKRLIYTQTQYIIAIIWHRIIREATVLTFYPGGFRSPPPGRIGFLDPGYDRVKRSPIAGVGATEITYIGEWDFTQYRRNAQFLMKI